MKSSDYFTELSTTLATDTAANIKEPRSLPIVSLPLYIAGSTVIYDGMEYTISYITVSKNTIYLTLDDMSTPILADDVICQTVYVDFNLMRADYDRKMLASLALQI